MSIGVVRIYEEPRGHRSGRTNVDITVLDENNELMSAFTAKVTFIWDSPHASLVRQFHLAGDIDVRIEAGHIFLEDVFVPLHGSAELVVLHPVNFWARMMLDAGQVPEESIVGRCPINPRPERALYLEAHRAALSTTESTGRGVQSTISDTSGVGLSAVSGGVGGQVQHGRSEADTHSQSWGGSTTRGLGLRTFSIRQI